MTSSNDETPRVLLIAPQPFFAWRGSPIRVSFNLKALAELGFRVDLLCMPMGEPMSIPGVRIVRPRNLFQIGTIPIGPSFRKAFLDLAILLKGLNLVFQHRYDVIHGIEEAGLIAQLLAKLSRAKVVFEKHSDARSYRGRTFVNLVVRCYSYLEILLIRYADAVIATGAGLAEQARQVAPRQQIYQISDIPSSLQAPLANKVQGIRTTLRQSDSEVIVMYVGSFAIYQGIDLLFDCIRNAVTNCPELRFVIIGGTEQEIATIRLKLRSQEVEQHVTFLGFIPPDELPNYLAAADIFVSPRTSGKNTPLKILDYFKAGKPIVAIKSEANLYILGQDGALFADPTPESLAQKIIELAKSPELGEKIANHGAVLIKNEHNFAVFKDRLAQCYSKLGLIINQR